MNAPYQPPDNIMAKLARKTVTFRARRILKYNLARPLISFSFDDFPTSAFYGIGLLEQEGWKATFYTSMGLCGIENHHGKNFHAEDLLRLQKAGHEIACHTYSHMDCANAAIEEIMNDIDENEKALAAIGIAKPEHFAYPYGSLNAKLKTVLAQRFKTMRGIKAGMQTGAADLNELRSYGIYSDKTLDKLLSDIKSLAYKHGWITVFAHDIRNNHSKWGCKPDDFARVVGAVKDIDAIVLPIGDALEYLEQNND